MRRFGLHLYVRVRVRARVCVCVCVEAGVGCRVASGGVTCDFQKGGYLVSQREDLRLEHLYPRFEHYNPRFHDRSRFTPPAPLQVQLMVVMG